MSAVLGLAVMIGCGSRPAPPPVRFDGGPGPDGRPGADGARPQDAEASPEDGGDAASPSTDASMGVDANPPPCSISMDVGAMVVGRDSDVMRAPRILTAASPSELVAVLSDDGDGERRVQLIRQPLGGGEPVSRQALEGIPEGAGAPAIARVGDGWLVAYETPGGGIAVQRYSSAWAASGAGNAIADRGSRPVISAVGTGAYVAWQEGMRLVGRALSATGAPTGAAVELGTLPTADAGYTLQAYGLAGEALVAIGGAETRPVRAVARRVSGTGVPAPGTMPLGATEEASGSMAIGAATPSPPSGLEPLQGAATFDVSVDGFGQVRFVVLGADGMPAFGEFTVSEPGEPAWGAGVAPFRTGYVVAYRARPADRGFSRVWLAFLERESCRLGRVDSRLVADVSASERGGAVSISSQGDTLFAGWAEVLEDVIEYRVVTAHCE